MPHWGDESLLFDIEYKDICNEHNILLIEILDEKPTLRSLNSSNLNRDIYKKIAWGYVLPCSTHVPITTVNDATLRTVPNNNNNNNNSPNAHTGIVNIGICDAWLPITSAGKAISTKAKNATAALLDTSEYTQVIDPEEEEEEEEVYNPVYKRLHIQLYEYQSSNIICQLQER